MQPDMKSPGPVEITPTTENVEANPGISKSTKSEVAARPAPSTTQASAPAQTVQASTTQTSNESASGGDTAQNPQSFEARIATLPAEESDTIEQAWVDQADEIEEKTAQDPYHEDDAQHALSRAYLKKRFGMDVK